MIHLIALTLIVLLAPVRTVAAANSTAARSSTVCVVNSWEVQWGVKESFRSYLSGSIANGEWLTEGKVEYQTPLFTISGSEGSVLADLSSANLSTTGSIRFLGHGGILDQTLSEPRVVVENAERAFLVFDVYGATQEGVFVDSESVNFVAVDISSATWDTDSGVWQVVDAPTTFTEQGQEAFGTYPAGEKFDPVTIRFHTTSGCLSAGQSPALPVIVIGTVVAVLATATALWVRKSRGRERPTPAGS